LRVIQENFEEGYVKAKEKKKKEWNERRMPINSKRKKKFQLKKDTTNAKSQHQKIKFHIF